MKDACNGHPTPGFASARYHYHMSPHCAWSDENTEGVPYTEIPGQHSPLLGWEFDGFGLYGHQDEGGSGHACTVSCADGNDDCTDDCEGGPMNSCHVSVPAPPRFSARHTTTAMPVLACCHCPPSPAFPG